MANGSNVQYTCTFTNPMIARHFLLSLLLSLNHSLEASVIAAAGGGGGGGGTGVTTNGRCSRLSPDGAVCGGFSLPSRAPPTSCCFTAAATVWDTWTSSGWPTPHGVTTLIRDKTHYVTLHRVVRSLSPWTDIYTGYLYRSM